MEERIESRNEELKRAILERYVDLSWKVADLSAAMSTPGHTCINDINYRIKRQLVDLSTLAMFNAKFAEVAGPICDQYRAGKHVTKPGAQKQKWGQVSKAPDVLRNARDTMLVWKVVSKALTESKLVSLCEV
ncbi:MAG: hypothetical protein M0R51_11820 [Clostridia bacterium]|jgi:hypothetical protein|nr:hypothetical protein [Clostridia bacterium]